MNQIRLAIEVVQEPFSRKKLVSATLHLTNLKQDSKTILLFRYCTKCCPEPTIRAYYTKGIFEKDWFYFDILLIYCIGIMYFSSLDSC